jgi:hypothetical protein
MLDLGGRRLLLPDSKTGKSVRPLAAPAMALLARLRERSGVDPLGIPGHARARAVRRPAKGLAPRPGTRGARGRAAPRPAP